MEITNTKQTRPVILYVLTGCLIFLSLGGLFGGLSFITDPSGSGMGMDVQALRPLALPNYLLPGIFLVGVYTLGSLVVLYGLWRHATWAWYGLIGLNLVLLGWLSGEVVLLGLVAPISIVLAILAVFMLLLAFSPSTRRYCETS